MASRTKEGDDIPAADHINTTRLLDELALMNGDANDAAGQWFNLDTPSAYRRLRGTRCIKRGAAYCVPNHRLPPARFSDAECDPAINHVEDTMVAWLDGETDAGGNALEPRWVTEHQATVQTELDLLATVANPWAGYDADTMDIVSFVDGKPVFRQKARCSRDGRPSHLLKKSAHDKSRFPRPSPKFTALTAATSTVSTPAVPPVPLSWDDVVLPNIVPE